VFFICSSVSWAKEDIANPSKMKHRSIFFIFLEFNSFPTHKAFRIRPVFFKWVLGSTDIYSNL
ncbi:MAG: hypothetical protein O3A40_09465, partial [Bacteroidetes bacterium]|nr:hypothetical protein [Bacteroidota bacterium]